jgi:hypothetical protein
MESEARVSGMNGKIRCLTNPNRTVSNADLVAVADSDLLRL